MKNILFFILFSPAFLWAKNNFRVDSSVLKAKNEVIQQIDALNLLSEFYVDIVNYIEAVNFSEKALSLAIQIDSKPRIGLSYRNIGAAYYMANQYTEALVYNHKAFDVFKELGDTVQMLLTQNKMGVCYKKDGDYKNAALCYFEALKINEQRKDSLNIAMCCISISTIAEAMEYYNEELKWEIKAYELRKGIEDEYVKASIALSIAETLQKLQRYNEAEKFIFEAQKSATINNCRPLLGAIYATYASILCENGKYYEALRNLDKSTRILSPINYPDKYSNIEYLYGEIYAEIGAYPVAKEYLQRCISSCIRNKNYRRLQNAYRKQSDVLFKMEKYQDAIYFSQQYQRISDSLTSCDVKNKIAEIKIQYETEKRENENIKLMAINDILQIKLLHKNGVIYILIIGLILILILSVFFFVFPKKKREIFSGSIALKQDDSVLEEVACETNIKESNNGAFPKLIDELLKYIEEEKPYLDSKITIDDLSKKLKTNRSYLSKAINSELKKNFNELINGYRLKEARILLTNKQNENISMDGISQMVGFSSRSAFYNNFKKQFGITPSSLRESMTEK